MEPELLAVTQENRLIKQNIYPIRNEHRTIGVIIVEIAADEEIQADLQKEELNNCQLAKVAKSTSQVDALFIDQLAEAVLIFDAAGHLLITNHNAQELYRKLGYRDNIIGMSYDNLSIDYTTFEYVLYQMKYKMSNQPIESKTTYLNYYFKVRKVWLASEEQLIMIIQDNTEFKEKEAEIISKSVAIREIHHRVKNNFPYCVFKNGERKAPKQRKSFMKVSIELWRLQPPMNCCQNKSKMTLLYGKHWKQ